MAIENATSVVVCKTVGELQAALANFPADMKVLQMDPEWGACPVEVQVDQGWEDERNRLHEERIVALRPNF